MYMFPLSWQRFQIFLKRNVRVSSVSQHCFKPAQQDLIQKKVHQSKSLWGFVKKCNHIFWRAVFVEHDRLVPIDSRGIDNRETWQRKESEKWIGKMSEGGVSLQPSPLPVRKKSIHHFHVFVSWLTLPIARSVAMMTQRIDEVQVGVASRGLGWRWSNQMRYEVGLGWTTRGTWWRSWCHP